jgi:ABC-type transport system involved in multi-copper enzyme maturation permease subunit
MARSLDRNPIGWLQRRSWSARLTVYAWCGLLITAETLLLGYSESYFWEAFVMQQFTLALLLTLGMAFAAVGSFRREKQTGAFELLLVTPLSERQIVDGRLRGIWRQFLPAYLLLVAAFLYLQDTFPSWQFEVGLESRRYFLTPLAGVLAMVPVLGLYFGMRRKNYIVAVIQTLVASMVLPWVVLVVVLLPFGLLKGALGDYTSGLELFLPLPFGPRIWGPWYFFACGLVAVAYRRRLTGMLTHRTFASA